MSKKLKQLSVFLENKPGNVSRACRILADCGINIETMALADTEQFGILRLLVKEWQRAKAEFESHDVIVKVSEVIAISVEHKPGGLANILEAMDDAKLNIEYMYGFSLVPAISKVENDSTIVTSVSIFRFNNPDLAIEKIKERGLTILGNKEIFGCEIE
ncbi:MAG: hypothetical protein LBE18_02155 [Planctomycetaceae bacterium]|jgi:hypothetical protein|nr:hypothetical protein [Planctomycetaceae bacterium]